MLAQERQAIIIDLLRERHFIKLTDITERFGISNLTARRDLDVLQDQMIIRRVYGGAVLITDAEALKSEDAAIHAAPSRRRDAGTEKQAIGAMASSLVQEGDVIFLGYGNSVLETAKHLKKMSNLTILTASLPVINELSTTSPSNTLYVLGGRLDDGDFIYGPHAERMLRSFCVDKSFISCTGVSLKNGVTGVTDATAELGRLAIQQAKQSILLCGSYKFDSDAMCVTCPLSDIDVLITDDGLSEENRVGISKLGISLHLVPACQSKP